MKRTNRIEKWYPVNLVPFHTPRLGAPYDCLRRYVNGVVIEWNKLVEVGDWINSYPEMSEADDKEYFRKIEGLSLEAHFYLICWTCARRHFLDLNSQCRSREIDGIWRRIKEIVYKAGLARNYYEHFEDQTIKSIGSSYAIDGGFRVQYYLKGQQTGEASWLNLGKAEVLQLTVTFEEITEILREQLSIFEPGL